MGTVEIGKLHQLHLARFVRRYLIFEDLELTFEFRLARPGCSREHQYGHHHHRPNHSTSPPATLPHTTRSFLATVRFDHTIGIINNAHHFVPLV